MITVIIMLFGSYVTLISSNLGMKAGVNYVLLGLFTFSSAWICAYVSIKNNFMVVVEASILTTAIFFGMFMVANSKKKSDAAEGLEPSLGGFLIFGPNGLSEYALTFGPFFALGSICVVFFEYDMSVMYCIGVLLVFMLLLFVEITLILRGDSVLKFCANDHIKCAVHLYLYVIGIFMTLVAILGGS